MKKSLKKRADEHNREVDWASAAIAAELSRFYDLQIRLIRQAVLQADIISGDVIRGGLQETQTHDQFIDMIAGPVIESAMRSAEQLFKEFRDRYSFKSFDLRAGMGFLESTVVKWLKKFFSMDFWRETATRIWKTVANKVDDWVKVKPDENGMLPPLFTAMLYQGKPIPASPPVKWDTVTPMFVADELTKFMEVVGKQSADLIGETEGNALVNFGKKQASDILFAAAGAPGDIMKSWVTMVDERVRPAHRALHGVSVAPDADFIVGGYPAPHPGHWSLPTSQRIYCRCFLIYGIRTDESEPGFRSPGPVEGYGT